LIATIQAFGANKEGENVFQLESFKQPLFENIIKDRSLVVMGYSGSDDFDIVPTLKVLRNVRNIIWINHSTNIEINNEKIYEIDANTSQIIDELDKDLRKCTRILFEIWQMNNIEHIYSVTVNSTNMVKQLLKSKPALSSKDFSINSKDWLEKNIEIASEVIKYFVPYKIYNDFGNYNSAMICSDKIFQFAKKSQDKYWEAVALNNIATIHYAQGNYLKALKRNEEALQINEKLENLNGKADCLNNIATIHYEQGNYLKALKRFEKALQIDEQLGDLSGKAIHLNNIAGFI
jgi:tetratricopeptide (TPR) repeat protein